MLKVKAGELDLMGLLFQRYHRQLYGFLFHMTYQKEASEDMVQQVFYKMLKYRASFAGTSEFVHWMYAIARNVLKDQGRKKKLTMAGIAVDELADVIPGGVEVNGQIERKQAAQTLQKAMAKLKEDDRDILSLSRFQELKHGEIAQIMNISEGAVKVRVHRAMCQLKEIYTRIER
ncbi:RNA polymerase sigma factor [Mucilaginibacter myungsuensis]|uniref:RNA polymerase sigma factor n=2 Tax=Mucilaginibacter myungsuensis TaxID=649104 RepID=A0A929L185_9SPHI|nr:RNA polymerase sigma factor [Mucilaginibacter myungsuensis]